MFSDLCCTGDQPQLLQWPYYLCLYLLQQAFQLFNICNFSVFFHKIKPLVLVAQVMFPKSKWHRKKLLPLAGLRQNKTKQNPKN